MDSQDRGFSQFLHTAASYIPDSSSPEKKTETETETATVTSASSLGHGRKPPSASEALSSAKIILDAAVSKLHKAESESGGDHQFDKAKVAAAASDVLAAAKHYGKLDENKHGKYMQKAEDYLNKYSEGNRTSSGGSAVHGSPPHSASHNSTPHTASHNSTPHTASHNSTPHSSSHSASENEEDNYGKYLKTAGDFLNKSTSHSSSHSASENEEDKYGKYLKTAGDLLNKF
ncbi:hypothetical protein SUGI_0915650 [Cryptomeria japonica]|uniref:nodulin-related protein 2 n=1 Tax=Cryptomeria japonica TaxID=3369 RepID=UPI002414BA35|nr:nodulin-related protein 2 [Cryptomeria japonica]GLJ43923.1 hypothetical protein SUGI_0915650 [Cryptomeria japonica]